MNHRNGLANTAYDHIKSMILQNQLKPGQLLKESELQELIGIGRTPIREALLKLENNDLVSIHSRKGIEIAKVSPKSIHDIFQVRILLEPSILKSYHQNILKETLMDFRRQFESYSQKNTMNVEHSLELADLDNQFHLAIVSSMENQYATRMMNMFVEKLTIIRSAVSIHNDQRYSFSNLEHIRIIDAIMHDEIDDACQLLEEHLTVSYDEAVKVLMQIS